MILIINLNKSSLHDYEFVKPITDLITKKHRVIHYKKLKSKDITKADKIILTGTSLKNYEYLSHYKQFSWINNSDKHILGICAGMHIIGKIFNAKIIKSTEIGIISVKQINSNSIFNNVKEVYSLHNFSISLPKKFKCLLKSKKCIQAIKHNSKEIYGVLFHPEILNKDLIVKFTE